MFQAIGCQAQASEMDLGGPGRGIGSESWWATNDEVSVRGCMKANTRKFKVRVVPASLEDVL